MGINFQIIRTVMFMDAVLKFCRDEILS